MFKQSGAEVIDADRIAHKALTKGTPSYRKIVQWLGRYDILNSRKNIERGKLACLVFRDPAKRRRLEKIVHPFVFREIEKQISRTRRPVAVVEVPLLFETGLDKKMDYNVVVAAPQTVQIKRARLRSGCRPGESKRRIAAQMPLARKVKKADFIIDNSGNLKRTRRQLEELWARFETLSETKR